MDRRIVAFVPVRGGSKSIPLKNIIKVFGKPLVFWSLKSLEETDKIDSIIVATDCELIVKTVEGFNFKKVKIFNREKENARDTSTTESVMLEYLQKSDLENQDIFVLVQATSPLTTRIHFEEAIEKFLSSSYDSMLSCVRTHRFFWDEDGNPKNYDYTTRPRRQDFKGELMENGAFYINYVCNIISFKNRISGKIGIYEMPLHTAVEIDEPDDIKIIESLMEKYVEHEKSTQFIKLFLSDVDGVLTDAGMYYTENGDELKKFNTRDGMAFQMLKSAGIKTGIITSECTKIVEKRGQKLKVDYLYQGEKHDGKLTAAIEICKREGFTLKEVAYIGDDINCYELLSRVGLAACPADAVEKIKGIKNIQILTRKGGEGAVREFVEIVLKGR